jgi:hypothetical protein
MLTNRYDSLTFVQAAEQAAVQPESCGRLSPEEWDDAEPTLPAFPRSRFDHEFGADLAAVEPEGHIS